MGNLSSQGGGGGGIPDPVASPSTWSDDIPLYLGDDQTGGLVNDVANGNGRALYVGDLTYTNALSVVSLSGNNIQLFRQSIGDAFDATVIVNANAFSSYFELSAYDESGAGGTVIRGDHLGVIDWTFYGPAPSFNVHDNLAILNPFSAPSAPTAAESATAGVVTAGTHKYALVLNTAVGHTEAGARSAQVTSDGSHKVDVTIPALPVGGVTWDLYRTVANDDAGDVLLVEAGVTPDAVYADNVEDGSLGDVALAYNNAGGNLSVEGEIRLAHGGIIQTDLDGAGESTRIRVGLGSGIQGLRLEDLPLSDESGISIVATTDGGLFITEDHTGGGAYLSMVNGMFDLYGGQVVGSRLNLHGPVTAPNIPTTTDPDVAGELFTCTAAELAGLLAAGAKYVLMSKHA